MSHQLPFLQGGGGGGGTRRLQLAELLGLLSTMGFQGRKKGAWPGSVHSPGFGAVPSRKWRQHHTGLALSLI